MKIRTKKDAETLMRNMLEDSNLETLIDGPEMNRVFTLEWMENEAYAYMNWTDSVNGTSGRDMMYVGEIVDMIYDHRNEIIE